MELYKGYVKTKNKKCIEKFKDVTASQLHTYEDISQYNEFAGILADDIILVDIDDAEQSEIMMNIVDGEQLDCKVIDTTRGKHFLFKNSHLNRCKTHCYLAIGLGADIKVGCKASYEVLKVNGEERFCEWDIEPDKEYQEIPKWFYPIVHNMDFIGMDEGDGRNQALFNYILTLQSAGFTVEEIRETITIINKYVLEVPVPDDELETILRDDAFQKPVFFNDKGRFLFNKLAEYMQRTDHVVLINNQLHIYEEGIYRNAQKDIEKQMVQLIPTLSDARRKETMKYMNITSSQKEVSDARYIGFKNGIYDIVEDQLLGFTPDIVITNQIPWDYVPGAYDELADHTLDKLACSDPDIRNLLEECIGYCFYRRNEIGKAFILTGDKSNGKSTFLDCVKAILGEHNVSALDLKELGDRFSTSMMYGRLANIGDDIGDDFLQGSQVSIFKKITTGNRIKAERKGQDPFEFNPYIKLLFSANDIPRMRDKTGAVLRRLEIIPFNASFSKEDDDYDPFIKYKLTQREPIEYMIQCGLKGLRRVLMDQQFTISQQVEKQLNEYEEENNPIKGFIEEYGEDTIVNEPVPDVYLRYKVFCAESSMTPMTKIVFSKQITKRMKLTTEPRRIKGVVKRIFVKESGY